MPNPVSPFCMRLRGLLLSSSCFHLMVSYCVSFVKMGNPHIMTLPYVAFKKKPGREAFSLKIQCDFKLHSKPKLLYL